MIISFGGSVITLISATEEIEQIEQFNSPHESNFGLFLAFVGTLLQALFMVVVKHLTTHCKIETEEMLFYSAIPTVIIKGFVLTQCSPLKTIKKKIIIITDPHFTLVR